MEMRGAIFDMDGTLIDSMGAWEQAGVDYMRSLGIPLPADLKEILYSKSITDATVQIVRRAGLEISQSAIAQDINRRILAVYTAQNLLKPGALALLEYFRASGVKMCVATATDPALAAAALNHNGIDGYFDAVLSCCGTPGGKNDPDIFFAACQKMGTEIENTWVFEDAVFAIRTAKKAGFPIAAVYDSNSLPFIEEITNLAHRYFRDFHEALSFFRSQV